MSADMHHLFRIAERLETCAPLALDEAQTLAIMVRAAISGESVEHALGLARSPGQRTLATQAAIAARDELLRTAAVRFYPELLPAAQARALACDLLRYYLSAWIRERLLDECPERYTGRIEETLWRILKTRDHAISAERIRKILVTS